MKLEDLEKVNGAANRKQHFEHAADCMISDVIMTFSFRGKTEKRGGQVHLTLDDQTANELHAIFERNTKKATDELTALGVDVGPNDAIQEPHSGPAGMEG